MNKTRRWLDSAIATARALAAGTDAPALPFARATRPARAAATPIQPHRARETGAAKTAR